MYSLDLLRMILWKYFRDQISYFALTALMGHLCSQKLLYVKVSQPLVALATGAERGGQIGSLYRILKKKYLKYKRLFYSPNIFMGDFYIKDTIFQREFSLISHCSVAQNFYRAFR